MDSNDLDNRTQEYLDSLRRTSRLSASEVPKDSYQQMISVLASVLVELSVTIKCGADWDEVKYRQPISVACVLLQDKKTCIEFSLMIDARSTVLEFNLPYFEELIHVDDSFWELILSLRKIGSVKYELSSSPVDAESEKWARSLIKYRKSSIFSMVVDYVLLFKERESVSYIGIHEFETPSITLAWPHGQGWEALFPILTKATEVGWRMNYLLYRSAHQKGQRKNKIIL